MGYIKEQPSYFRIVFGRGHFKKLIIDLLQGISTPFRFIPEVFIRRRMGERYFSGLLSLFWSIIFLGGSIFSFTDRAKYVIPEPYLSNLNAVGIFGILFFAFSIWRWIESYHNPATVSFDKFSKSSGDLTLIFKMLHNKNVSIRLIEIWLEPLFFLLIGIVLVALQETRILGLFLVFCALMYSISYRASYSKARDYILDIIDEKISTLQLGHYVKKGLKNEESRGFRSRAPMPTEADQQKLLSKLILMSDPTGEETSIAK